MRWRSRTSADPLAARFPGFTDIVEIGTGSLSTVYRARETETGRTVALKLLTLPDIGPRALESFQRETLALGALASHPHIVTLLSSTRSADGRPLLVLELCSGSIAQRITTDRLTVAEIVSLGVKLCGALETAHRAQILHRDVKPQNILLTEFGEPALADFGVAMLQASTQTTVGLFDFTTLHVAPELLEGNPTSPATDVYELASTLYQLITGQSAFRAYDGESPAAVILRILRDQVMPIGPLAPPRLSDLLIQAMAKDPAARPASAALFGAALREIEASQGWPSTALTVRAEAPRTVSTPTGEALATGPWGAPAALPVRQTGLRQYCPNDHLVGAGLGRCPICGADTLHPGSGLAG